MLVPNPREVGLYVVLLTILRSYLPCPKDSEVQRHYLRCSRPTKWQVAETGLELQSSPMPGSSLPFYLRMYLSQTTKWAGGSLTSACPVMHPGECQGSCSLSLETARLCLAIQQDKGRGTGFHFYNPRLHPPAVPMLPSHTDEMN